MDKFKTDIQHKFSQRELEPSDESWGKITGGLATSRTKKTKSLWLWSGIAAGFLGLLVLLTPLYLSTSTNESVVDSEKKESTQEVMLNRKLVLASQLKSQGLKTGGLKWSPITSDIQIPKINPIEKPDALQMKAISLLAEVEKEIEKEHFSQHQIDEVDALLAEARIKLSSEKDHQIFDQLNAEILLAEIDFQNNNSFRDKIWKLIEVNFNELKSSFGSR